MRVFLSYAQADQAFRDQLVTHLSLLRRDRILETWDAHEITGGTEKEQAIAQQLDAAKIILLLISADFIASDRYDIEMQRAIERHENQEARVIPILLKPCDWQSAPFADLEVLPKGGKPVTSGDPEAAFASIAQEIRRVAIELNPALAKPKKSPMKLGAPLPGVRLPDNFVERPEALNAVKALLLEESEKPLVVSAIAGLGGLGKSVLAAALVLDAEVQARFEDGILWVTLGQNPDLQSLLGDWIRMLDKSRESYSATTLESASRYLQTLLIEKRMLLVVDDVWNGAHVEHFRVGGAECRMLVTTREAQIDGAEYHALNLMTEEQAIELVRQKLKRRWQADQEAEVKAFAKSLGYLPLALDLAANQVREGFSWAELRSEFEAERRSVALDVLDSPEAWDCLDEAQQRKYSLRACFNLSLRRLSAEQLRQFAWLGVLPEDVTLDARMAMTLWALPKLQAKKALVVLKNRSFLTSGTETLEGEPTYRVHDLMHDTARGLIEQGTISSAIQTLPAAHAQLLERYRAKANDRWDRVPNDGYIHRHLTWHLEQAGLEDEIHALLAMSDEQGRNAWFEMCDRIGQPAIFVQDVKRAWKLAEESYGKKVEVSSTVVSSAQERSQQRRDMLQTEWNLKHELLGRLRRDLAIETGSAIRFQLEKQIQAAETQLAALSAELEDLEQEPIRSLPTSSENCCARSIVLQCRYALITATLNTLVNNLPIEMMVEFVKHQYWTPEQAWAYVEQIQDEGKVADAIKKLVPYLPKSFFLLVLNTTQEIKDKSRRVSVLSALAEVGSADFTQLLNAVQVIRPETIRASALCALTKVNSADFTQLLKAVQAVQSKASRALILCALAQVDSAYFAEALETTQAIQSEPCRARILHDLAQVDFADFAQLFKAAQTIQDEPKRGWVLSSLAQMDSADFAQLFKAAQTIQDGSSRARVLSSLAQVDPAYFAEALNAARTIQDESNRARVLSSLAQVDPAYFAEALNATQAIQSEASRASALGALAQMDSADFAQLLNATQAIQSEASRASALGALAQVRSADLPQLLETAWAVQDEFSRASVLSILAQEDSVYCTEALEAAQVVRDEFSRAQILHNLTQVNPIYCPQLLETARAIQDEPRRAQVLIALAQIDSAYFAEALEAVQAVRDESKQVWVLHNLAQVSSADFTQLLRAAQAIQNKSRRAWILRDLVQMKSADHALLLKAARAIQNKFARARVLSALAQVNSVYFAEALKVARAIQDDSKRVSVLCDLAQLDSNCFAEALEAARAIQDDSKRVSVLCDLAQLDSNCFAEALEAAQAIQDNFKRASMLCGLAHVKSTYFAEALKAVRGISGDIRRVEVLRRLAQQLPDIFLPQAFRIIDAIIQKDARAQALSAYLPRLSLTTLSYAH